MSNKSVNILIPLDVLLDTRIATIALMDEDKAINLLQNGYHNRRSDLFLGIDKNEFLEKYSQRDELTLAKSQCTGIRFVLEDMIDTLHMQSETTPYHDKISITINTYPYKIKFDTLNLIIKAISGWLKFKGEIRTVYLSDEDLTPELIKSSYDILFMYHYAQWLETQVKNFENTSINNCNLYVPAISFEHDLNDKFLESIVDEGMHPLEALKFLLAPFINLEPIDVEVFSVLNVYKT